MDGIFRPLSKQIAKAFEVAVFQVEEVLAQEPNASAVASFCSAEGLPKLLVYLQRPASGRRGDADEEEEPQIYVSSGDSKEVFVDRGVLLLKSSQSVELTTAAAVETHVSCTIVLSSPIKALLATVERRHCFA